MKHLLPVVLMAAALGALPCGAQTFSVALLEDTAGSDAAELSNYILDGALDYLFSAGFVATNESIGRVTESVYQTKEYGIASAREGYVEYLALVWIRYIPSPENPDVTLLKSAQWRLVRVGDGSVLATGEETSPVAAEVPLEDLHARFFAFGKSLASVWAKVLADERG